MKALVFGGPGEKAWNSVPDPGIQEPTDVIVKVDTTTICGTDLHILKGDVPAVTDGRILDLEGVGTVTETGSAVKGLQVGDRDERRGQGSAGRRPCDHLVYQRQRLVLLLPPAAPLATAGSGGGRERR